MKKAFIFFLLILTCLIHLHTVLADDIPAVANKEGNSTFPVEELFEEARKPDDKFFMEFVNMLFTLGLIIGLILIIAWFLKRMVNSKLEQANLTSSIRILERRTLSPKTSIYLIEIYSKTVVLAESTDGIALLTEFPFSATNSETRINEEPPSSFKSFLENKP